MDSKGLRDASLSTVANLPTGVAARKSLKPVLQAGVTV